VTGCTTSISRTSIILIYVLTLSHVRKLLQSLFVSVNANATVCWNFIQYDISLKNEGVCLRNILYFFIRGRNS
jgi:hypothetical protein